MSCFFLCVIVVSNQQRFISTLNGSCHVSDIYDISRGPFYKQGLTLIAGWIFNHIHYNVWDEISLSFPNFNCCAIEVISVIAVCELIADLHKIKQFVVQNKKKQLD